MYTPIEMKITLTRDMLGTNPLDPNVLDKHIIERQRKIIMEKSKVNAEINKYLDALPIAKDRGQKEVEKLIANLEHISGYELTDDERRRVMAGELEFLKETFEAIKTTGTTVFFWDKETDRPCIGDHMIYGFMKAATEALARTAPAKRGTVLHSASYTASLINQHVRCDKQFLTFDRGVKTDDDGNPFYLQRSIRAMTAQGPRVSLVKSEVVPAGASLTFTLNVLAGSPLLKHVDYTKTEEKTFPDAPLKHIFDYGQMTGLGQWRNSGYGMFTYEMIRKS